MRRKSLVCPAPATSGAAWDNGAVIELPAGTVEIDVSVDEDTYLICTASATYALENPAYVPGGTVKTILCANQLYLHHKKVSAAATVSVTPYTIST